MTLYGNRYTHNTFPYIEQSIGTVLIYVTCNTSTLKQKFWKPKELQYFTSHKYTNCTLNTVSGQGKPVQMPYFTFKKSYIHTEFFSLPGLQLIAKISYVISLLKYGFTIFTSHSSLSAITIFKSQWRVPTLFITRYGPRSLACSLFLWPGDDTETLSPESKTWFCDFLSLKHLYL